MATTDKPQLAEPAPTAPLPEQTPPRQVSIYQLANDRVVYGPHAGWFIIVTPDGDTEIAPYAEATGATEPARPGPFPDAKAAIDYAITQGWDVVPLKPA